MARYEREEEEERREAQRRVQNEGRLELVEEEYLDRREKLENIRKEYIKWLRGQITDNPSVHYATNIIDEQSLSQDEMFHVALVEIRWKRGGAEKAKKVRKYSGGIIYDYSQSLRDTKDGYYDAVLRTDGETKPMRVNPVTRNDLLDITRDFWRIARGDKNSTQSSRYQNRIFLIASTSPKKLRDFTDRIKPRDVHGMRQDASPGGELWKKFAEAAGPYNGLFAARTSEVNDSYQLLEKYKNTYKGDVMNVVAESDTTFIRELLANFGVLVDMVKVDGNIVSLLQASVLVDNPDVVKFFVDLFSEADYEAQFSPLLSYSEADYEARVSGLLSYAIMNDSPSVAEMLIGLDGYVVDSDQIKSVIESTRGERKPRYVKLLLDAGADPNTTPSALTMWGINKATAKLLIEAGADVRRVNGVLHPWVERKNVEMVRLLLERGADPNDEVDGETAYDLTRWKYKDRELRTIRDLLIEAGGGPFYYDLPWVAKAGFGALTALLWYGVWTML